jgi:hypothetical protein
MPTYAFERCHDHDFNRKTKKSFAMMIMCQGADEAWEDSGRYTKRSQGDASPAGH